jgi:CRISPR-associated protein Csd2
MNQKIPRVTGLLVIEVRNSNPNGDPDRESDPRTRAHDGKGMISDVSFKRKLRELVLNCEGEVWIQMASLLGLSADTFKIHVDQNSRNDEKELAAKSAFELQMRVAEIKNKSLKKEDEDGQIKLLENEAKKQYAKELCRQYWDIRVFGSTSLETGNNFVRNGAVQFSLGVSAAKVRIQRDTNTVKANVDASKDTDRGMAPLGFRVVEHGVYAMPFLVNPTSAAKSGCTRDDIELLCRLIPYAYAHNASRIRPLVEVRHAWYFEHNNQLGSASDFAILDALTPTKSDPTTPSSSWDDYAYDGGQVSTELQTKFSGRFKHFGDLTDPAFVDKVFPRKHG